MIATIALVLLLLVLSGFFSGSETALTAASRSRMRALESRRFVLRAANDGVSAVIAPDGRIVAQAAEFSPVVLRGQFTPRQGATPYLAAGNLPMLGLTLALLVLPLGRGLRSRSRDTIQVRARP